MNSEGLFKDEQKRVDQLRAKDDRGTEYARLLSRGAARLLELADAEWVKDHAISEVMELGVMPSLHGAFCPHCGDYGRYKNKHEALFISSRGCQRCQYEGETGNERHLLTPFMKPTKDERQIRLTTLAAPPKYLAVHLEVCGRCRNKLPCFVADELMRELVSLAMEEHHG